MTSSPIQIDPQTGQALTTLLTSSVFASLDSLGWVRVTGSDRVRWLNGMVTNSIQALTPGQGCYNFVLNAQGRIQADLTAFLLEDTILIETARDRIPTLIALLDHFIIMDDVELTDLSEHRAGLVVAGPAALRTIRTLDLGPKALDPLTLTPTLFRGQEVILVHAYSPLVPRIELWSDPKTISALAATLRQAGTPEATPDALTHLRILEGTPLYGADIRDKDLPQETAQTRALHFAKGCYLGQEIVERIRSRGNVHRTFSGFLLAGDLPPAGTVLTSADAPDKPVGELTSVAAVTLPFGPVQIALGYIRREALDRNLRLHYPGGEAKPVPLPFSAAQSQTTASLQSASD